VKSGLRVSFVGEEKSPGRFLFSSPGWIPERRPRRRVPSIASVFPGNLPIGSFLSLPGCSALLPPFLPPLSANWWKMTQNFDLVIFSYPFRCCIALPARPLLVCDVDLLFLSSRMGRRSFLLKRLAVDLAYCSWTRWQVLMNNIQIFSFRSLLPSFFFLFLAAPRRKVPTCLRHFKILLERVETSSRSTIFPFLVESASFLLPLRRGGI